MSRGIHRQYQVSVPSSSSTSGCLDSAVTRPDSTRPTTDRPNRLLAGTAGPDARPGRSAGPREVRDGAARPMAGRPWSDGILSGHACPPARARRSLPADRSMTTALMAARDRLRVAIDRLGRDPGQLLALVLLLALITRAAWLWLPQGSLIFDEAYYVNAARTILGLPFHVGHYAGAAAGFDPNAEHPPLGKALMAMSMAIFGDNGIGWRLPSVLAGMVALAAVYGVIRATGETARLGLLAVTLFALDNLGLVHGRIGTLDMLALAPMLVGAWLGLRGHWGLAGVACAVATMVKLTGGFAVVALLLFQLIVLLMDLASDRPHRPRRSQAVDPLRVGLRGRRAEWPLAPRPALQPVSRSAHPPRAHGQLRDQPAGARWSDRHREQPLAVARQRGPDQLPEGHRRHHGRRQGRGQPRLRRLPRRAQPDPHRCRPAGLPVHRLAGMAEAKPGRHLEPDVGSRQLPALCRCW